MVTEVFSKQYLCLFTPKFFIFSKFEHQNSTKSWKIHKIFGTFEGTISKCPNMIRKNTFFLAFRLYPSPSTKLKLFVNHYGTPSNIQIFVGPLKIPKLIMEFSLGWLGFQPSLLSEIHPNFYVSSATPPLRKITCMIQPM